MRTSDTARFSNTSLRLIYTDGTCLGPKLFGVHGRLGAAGGFTIWCRTVGWLPAVMAFLLRHRQLELGFGSNKATKLGMLQIFLGNLPYLFVHSAV